MICHDCRVEEGYRHMGDCDMEKCPKCGDNLSSCDCYQHIKEAIDICFYETKKGTPYLQGQVMQKIEEDRT